ncbi:uncharacterized protein BDFB_007416 [Asbolus verrucosus]|uniref:Transcription termination factor 5, mitochondrial n=1 Tax=Asbolus verrucosus TaxID=1661398 RepID=A0A482W2V4_ASBVE|nr:uncharacterized protein BDFB_007416 [Asbolus verrucosus]
MVKSITFCKELGFDNKSILKNPILLRANPNTLDQYYTVMKEGGFNNITAEVLAKFRTLCRKEIITLKKAHLIDPQTDVAESFISHLNPRPENFYVRTEGDSESWSSVHLQVLTEYLKWRLQATDADVAKLIKIHPGICRKSFRYLCENIATAQDLGFTPEKMLKYGYILHNYPKYTKTVLAKYPEIAGASMRKAMRMYPKLVNVSPSNIEKIYNILKKHNISDEAIQKRMNVFHMSPQTVELRLEELKRVEDLKVLFHNPNILKLVVHHNRAKSRLSYLKQLQLKCAGVSVLGNDDSKFNMHVKEGRDSNTSSDTFAFLKGIFNEDTDRFETNFKKHPYYLQVSLVSMEETYNYLISENYSSAAILNVIYILLYPKEKIQNNFKQVDLFETRSNKVLTQTNRLNLVLYFIEKEHHFTGDGIWTKSESLEEGS